MSKTSDASAPEHERANGMLGAETHRKLREIRRIGSRAVREAQEESRRLGVPNVYSYGGVIHYEQPDGTLSTEDPYEGENTSGVEERNA